MGLGHIAVDSDRRETVRPTWKGTSSKEVEVSSESCQALEKVYRESCGLPFPRNIKVNRHLTVAECCLLLRWDGALQLSAFNIPLTVA